MEGQSESRSLTTIIQIAQDYTTERLAVVESELREQSVKGQFVKISYNYILGIGYYYRVTWMLFHQLPSFC